MVEVEVSEQAYAALLSLVMDSVIVRPGARSRAARWKPSLSDGRSQGRLRKPS
jgi:hypothetical protein